MPRDRRLAFLADMDPLGAAVGGLRAPRPGLPADQLRDPRQPGRPARARASRYEWELAEVRNWLVYRYPDEVRRDPAYALGARHDHLRADLAAELDRLIGHGG